MKNAVCLFLCLIISSGAAAIGGPRDSITRYQKFNYNFVVGIFQSYRNFENSFQQFKLSDSAGKSRHDYTAESRLVSGFEFAYDKLSFAIGLRSVPPKQSEGKGATRTLNTNVNFGGNIWYFQNTLRYFKGFYDANTGAYDTTIRQPGRYYQRPDLSTLLIRSKFLYFTHHHKFAFRSAFSANYRQLRSAATWVLSANINYSSLQADSSFFNYAARPFYGDYAGMYGLNVFGIAANAGAAGTLVIMKGFFLTGMFIFGPEQQWRNYYYPEGLSRLSYLSFSGDLRLSIGVNLKRCYFVAFNTNDFSLYNGSYVGLNSKSIGGGFVFGWRFSVKPPAFYTKFQDSKFYKAL